MNKNNNGGDALIHHEAFGRFIGTSSAIQDIRRKIADAAATDNTVFITGSSGTGKELAAQSLHLNSKRRKKPFIALNCAALPANLVESALFGHVKGADHTRAGAIEQAEGGTLFLDEIGDMPLDIQAKLLRFTQDFTYQKLGGDKFIKANIRLICATNKDPQELIKKNLFREDLYYRLYILPIHIPDLKDRGEDVVDLAYYFLNLYGEKNNTLIKDFSESTLQLFCKYDWPGNIRELENLIQQLIASIKYPVVMETMLPDHIQKYAFRQNAKALEETNHISLPLWQIEKRAIEQAIAFCGGNIPKAAALLDIAPSTIYRKKLSWDEK